MSPSSSHREQHRILVGLATLAFVFTAIAMPSLASAQDGLCQDDAAGFELSGQLSSLPATSTSSVAELTSEWPATPCDQNLSADSPGYNICFEATPYPHTTVPEWLTQWQAEEAVSSVFERVNEIHAERTSQAKRRMAPLEFMPERAAWIANVVDKVNQANAAGESTNICVETSDETCKSLPPATAMISMATVIPAERAPLHPRLPPTVDSTLTQSILVDLRVGPGLEYRRLPERPPASSPHTIS